MTVWDLQKYRDLPAVVTDQGECFSYHDLDRLQEEFAINIRQGTLVCIFADNNMASLIAYLSCLMNRIVPIMMAAEKDQGWESLLTEYHPEYIWLSADKYEKSIIGLVGYKEIFSFSGYLLLEKTDRVERTLHPELALLLPTSGSTGNPQLVRLSIHNILTNTVSICAYMGLTKDDRAVTSLPFSYTYGLSIINTILYSGGSIFLTGKSIVQPAFWHHMRKYDVTVFSGVPYTYECMKKLNISLDHLEKLRILTQAGGKLSEEMQCYWGSCASVAGKLFFLMYGQTEATARIAYLPWQDCLRKPGSVGVAVPGSELVLIDTEGHRITGAYKEGEIVCRGGQVSMGYAGRKEDLVLGDVNRGCLHTGDTGHFDEDGYLYVDGRMNRFAKIYGKRIDLVCLEKTASGLWGREVIVLSDDRKLYIYTEKAVTPDDLASLREQTGLGKEVMEIRQMEEIPRQYNGKIKYGR